jgi:hypothetical protein
MNRHIPKEVIRLILFSSGVIFGIAELIYHASDPLGRLYLIPVILPFVGLCYLFGMSNNFRNELLNHWSHSALLVSAVLWAALIAAAYWIIKLIRSKFLK